MGRSGGRSGGSRSGGGRSGGSRSSGRSASGGFSGSTGRSVRNFGTGHMGPVIRPTIRPTVRPIVTPTVTPTVKPVETTGAGPGGGAVISGIAIAIWTFIVVFILAVAFGGGTDSNGITKSTVNRDKLHLQINKDAGYYTDECDWIRNRTVLESGLKEFYDSTGIMPYIYIIDNVNGDYDPSTEKLEAFAEAKYEELFTDEGHALLLFWDYGGAYEYVLMLGYDTMKFMDSEACDILFDYLDYYYYYAETEEEFFGDAFEEAGKRMMTVSRSPLYYILIVAVIAVLAFTVYKVYKSHKDKEAERKKRAEEILNAPLEKFGENGDIIDELEKKYEKEI